MINEVRIIGNLGQNPKVMNNTKGTMAIFSVATTEKWKDKRTGDWMKKTEWHKCVAFGYPAEYVDKWFTEGCLVYVEGSMQYGKYEKEGIEIPTAEIKVQKAKLLSKGRNSDNGDRDSLAEYEDRPMSTGEDVPF